MTAFLKIVSYVFQPLLIPTYGVLLLMQIPLFQFFGGGYRAVAVVGTLLFTGIFPALPILLMIRKGQIRDLFISRREERTMPYLFSVLTYVFWVAFLWRTLRFPSEFIVLAISAVISLVLVTLINLKWKISAHTTGMGVLMGCLLAVSYLIGINPVGLIVVTLIAAGLVAVSRMYLKAHTFSQTISGFGLGLGTVLISLFVYVLLMG